MKARPRAVENRIADALNEHFKRLGMSPVERIPVLGRTGPDLTLNELGLVVDVKSRKEVPRTLFFPLMVPFHFGSLVAARLVNFNVLLDRDYHTVMLDLSSKLIQGYLDHMQEWTSEHAKGAISCVILHRPEMPIGSSVVVIHSNNRRRLLEHAERYAVNHPRK